MIKNVLIKTTPATALDCSNLETVTGIKITSAEPDNTTTRYLISVDGGKWRKFVNGSWDFAAEQELTTESVLAEGNTKAELTALRESQLTAFAGKIIDIAVAMSVQSSADLPSISKFEVTARNNQIKKAVLFSNVIRFSEDSVGITEIDVAKNESNGGAVTVFASVQNDAGEWSDYVAYEKIQKKGKAVRLKAEVEVDKPSISTAILDNVKVYHWQSSKSATIEGKSVLITKPITLDNKVSRAHAIIRHPKTDDTDFKLSVVFGETSNFADMTRIATYDRGNEVEEDFEFVATDTTASKVVTLKVEILQNSGKITKELLGTGTGKQQSFKLTHHAKAETLVVEGCTEWTFKENTDTLIVTANNGNSIYVSYDWIAKTTYLTALACMFNS